MYRDDNDGRHNAARLHPQSSERLATHPFALGRDSAPRAEDHLLHHAVCAIQQARGHRSTATTTTTTTTNNAAATALVVAVRVPVAVGLAHTPHRLSN